MTDKASNKQLLLAVQIASVEHPNIRDTHVIACHLAAFPAFRMSIDSGGLRGWSPAVNEPDLYGAKVAGFFHGIPFLVSERCPRNQVHLHRREDIEASMARGLGPL